MDVIVVGGGIVGCATAHYLHAYGGDGIRITIVDAVGVAASASGRAGEKARQHRSCHSSWHSTRASISWLFQVASWLEIGIEVQSRTWQPTHLSFTPSLLRNLGPRQSGEAMLVALPDVRREAIPPVVSVPYRRVPPRPFRHARSQLPVLSCTTTTLPRRGNRKGWPDVVRRLRRIGDRDRRVLPALACRASIRCAR